MWVQTSAPASMTGSRAGCPATVGRCSLGVAFSVSLVWSGCCAVACLGVVGDLCAVGERAIALTDDRAVMDEQVLGPVIGRDEAKPLVVTEPLDGTCSHCVSSCVDRAANAEIAEQRLRPLALRCW